MPGGSGIRLLADRLDAAAARPLVRIRTVHVPDKIETSESAQYQRTEVDLPPVESKVSGTGKGMMIVMPPLTKREDGH